MTRFFVLFFLILPLSLNAQQALKINTVDERINVTSHLQYFIDESKTATPSEIISGTYDKDFRRVHEESINLGYIRKPVWFRLDVDASDMSKDLILAVNERCQYADFYISDSSNKILKHISSGIYRPISQREITARTLAFHLPEASSDKIRIFLCIRSNISLGLSVNIWSAEPFFRTERRQNIAIALFCGFLAALIFYQALLGLFLRSWDFVLFSMLLFVFLLICTTSLVIISMLFSGPWQIQTFRFQLLLFSSFAVVFRIFSRGFITVTHRYLKHVPLLLGLFYTVIVIIGIVSPAPGFLFAFLMPLISLDFFHIAVLAALSSFQKRRDSLLFSISFIPTFALFLIRSLDNSGLISENILTRYGIFLSVPITVLLFSSALAFRFHSVQREAAHYKELSIRRLESLNRNKDNFLSSTAHELRTPLHGIIGLTSAVLQEDGSVLSSRSVDNLESVSMSAWRLSSLVNDILDSDKIRSGNFQIGKQTLDFRPIAKRVVSGMAPLFRGKKLSLELRIPEVLPSVSGDENRIQQILYNLLGNALRFTLEGTVLLSAEPSADMLIVTIEDSGIGIPEEQAEIIFERYEQGGEKISRRFGGTGLGLSLTKHLVELHNGRIWFESQEGKGSRFMFSLPLAAGSGQNVHEKTSPSLPYSVIDEATAFSGIEQPLIEEFDTRPVVVAVDDDPINLKVIESYLPSDRYYLILLSSGKELVELIKNTARLDLVLIDLYLPDIMGTVLCADIRERYSALQLPILMLTASRSLDDIIQSFAHGTNDYIAKPVSKEELLARVDTQIALKKAVEHKDLTNRMLNEIDSLVSFGFLASAFLLSDEEADSENELLLDEMYKYFLPIMTKYIDNTELAAEGIDVHSRNLSHRRIFTRLKESGFEKIEAMFQEIRTTVKTREKTIGDIERISSEIYNLVAELLYSGKEKNSHLNINTDLLIQKYRFTAREIEIIQMVIQGATNQEIVEEMGITLNTVKHHLYNIYNKTGVDNRSHMVYTVLKSAEGE